MKRLDPAGGASARLTLAQAQAAGFPVGAENLAVDLADTLARVTTSPVDLLRDQAASDRFWELHAGELPVGWAFPPLAETRRLRDVIRSLLDAAQQGMPLDERAVHELNAFALAASASAQLTVQGAQVARTERWRYARPAHLALAAAAFSAIDTLGDPAIRSNLRQCARPLCTMLFFRGDRRRRWCTPNTCGNRDRVARHYRRRHPRPT